MYKKYVKLIFDFLIVVILAPFWLLIFCLIFLLVYIVDGSPVLYFGERVGKDLKLFNVIKFRTMRVNTGNEKTGDTVLAGDPRVTNLGLVLRKYKLDEIPQLFQVLSGQMSLVGPRPELYIYVDRNFYKKNKISSLRPGITDLSSVKYRHLYNLIKKTDNSNKYIEREVIPKKNLLRKYYAKKVSFCFDMLIIIKTIRKLFT